MIRQVCNVVDDAPVRQVDFFRGLAELTGRPSLQKRVSNRRLKTVLGYRFRYPTFREGAAAFLCKQNLRQSL